MPDKSAREIFQKNLGLAKKNITAKTTVKKIDSSEKEFKLYPKEMIATLEKDIKLLGERISAPDSVEKELMISATELKKSIDELKNIFSIVSEEVKKEDPNLTLKSINKKLDLVIGVLFVVALAFGVSAQGADTGTVSATLTVQNVSLTVSDGTVAYGTQSAGAMTSTLLTGDIQTVTNNGNITENFNIKGQDSANWTLASSSSTDQYTHQFSTTTGSSWTSLTTSYATLDTSKAAAATSTFDLRIYVPSASTNYTSQSVDVTVQAVAS